ncbi:hypothetical protein [Candidatus Phytoplasma sp. AldY-WA1]|uniref:hypothetical protein n=1 Tax=Candidatus Phytoplasma sp. AldY-WA1 TaxID=2852100 RepID=UPI00254D92DA|nr:hypothetical protein [Candidatus Phytoplasma sp. AldY-WA1]
MNSKERNILLFIIISIIFIGIGFYILKPKNNFSTTNIEENTKQQTESTPIEKSKEVETPKPEIEPKIPISQTRFDEIKNYILSLDDNLLPKNLNPTEKTKIEEIRTTKKSILQRRSGKIKDKQKEIDDYNDKLNKIENKKNELKKQQQTPNIENEIADLEADKDMYTEMLNRAKENKKELEQDYKDLSVSDEKITIIQLNKIYQITN